MKKRLTILTCFMVLCSFVFGQSHWGKVETGNYQVNMNAIVSIEIDGIQQTDSDIEIGAFCEGVLRGYGKISLTWNQYTSWFQIHGSEGDNITYRLWIPATEAEPGKELFTNFTTVFNSENTVGQIDPYEPQVINFTTPVAEINGEKFATLQAALDAATDGQTVKLLSNIEISNGYNDKEFVEIKAKEGRTNITLDLNNYTISQVIKDNGLSGVAMTVRAGQHLTITDNSTEKGGKISACSSVVQLEGELTLADGTLSVGENPTQYEINPETGFAYAVWMYIRDNATQYPAFNMTGGKIEIAQEMLDIHAPYNYANAVVVNDYTAAYDNTKVNIEGGEFNGTIVVAEGTETTGSVLENMVLYRYDANYVRVAKTVAEFNDAFTNESEFKLGANIQGSGVVINKDIKIDFGGFTYTFTSPAVGSTGTQTQGFQILKDNTVTLKNGTLNVAAAAGEDFAMLIQNYADLTITNMTLDGDHLDRNNYSYVLSVNCGNVVIDGSTSILANEVEGENHFAFDSYDYSAGGYTELPVVTVNTTGNITGIVEVSATLNLTAVGEGSDITVDITGNGQLYNAIPVKGSMKKKVEGTEDGWGTISSPVGTVEHSNVSGLITNNTHDLYRYNENSMMWENVKDENHSSDFHTLNKGVGYLYANTADTDVVFEGTFISDNLVDISLGYTANELAGFHFIGNPFTHNINEKHFTTTDADKLRTGFYAVTYEGGLVARTTGTIAPMESVMIQTTGSAVLYINKKEQVSASKRGVNENNGQLQITVSNAKYSDVAYVSFNEGLGLDKINHRNAEIPMVYVPVEGVNYAIAMMNQEVTEIPVSFEAKSMGQYTIGVEAQDCEYAMMTLVDRFTGVETNLLIEDYTFMATSNDNAERFIIKLAMSNSNDGDNENFAFINNGMMYIYNIEGRGVVNVYDVTGRPVAEYNVAESANISTSDFAAGVYIIRMSDENGVKVQKIVVE